MLNIYDTPKWACCCFVRINCIFGKFHKTPNRKLWSLMVTNQASIGRNVCVWGGGGQLAGSAVQVRFSRPPPPKFRVLYRILCSVSVYFSLREALAQSNLASTADPRSICTICFRTNPLSTAFSHWYKKDKWRRFRCVFPSSHFITQGICAEKKNFKVSLRDSIILVIQRPVKLSRCHVWYNKNYKKSEKLYSNELCTYFKWIIIIVSHLLKHGVNWIHLTHDRIRWQTLVNTAVNLRVWNTLTSWTTLPHGVCSTKYEKK